MLDRITIEPLYDVAVTLLDHDVGNVQITIRNGSRSTFAVLNTEQWEQIIKFVRR